jgi:predicted short-subunit dehydrogenase-like oxidoreductase (DUF2520 family)
VARGDEATIEMHREALGEVRPDLVEFYDCMVERTTAVAGEVGSAEDGRP